MNEHKLIASLLVMGETFHTKEDLVSNLIFVQFQDSSQGKGQNIENRGRGKVSECGASKSDEAHAGIKSYAPITGEAVASFDNQPFLIAKV